ncbi:MAG: PQQ-binding-like beta-propeller repeat protein [Planctomycetota bacterium]
MTKAAPVASDAASPASAVAGTPEVTIASKPAEESEPKLVSATTSAAAMNRPDTILSAGGDWPQWGGTTFKNNAPGVKGLPESWDIGRFDRRTGEWNKERVENVTWFANLGSQTYGNPVVAEGRVFVGTNNGAGYLKRYPSKVDLGCLLAFNEGDGEFLWQHSSEKLSSGRVHDWPMQGICCSPLVEGDRLWFVTSRGEVRCLDTAGFYDGEDDGPMKEELARVFDLESESDEGKAAIAALEGGKLSESLTSALEIAGETVAGDPKVESVEPGVAWTAEGVFGGSERVIEIKKAGKQLSVFKRLGINDQQDADTIWVFDMMAELGISQHNMCSCSVTGYGDLLFVATGNGQDESHDNLPSPEAPSFLCLDKKTGEVVWTDASPGMNILHGQWSSPAVGELGGVPQVLFCGGDGWLYSFKADRGKDGAGELLWKFDCNPKETKWMIGGEGSRNNLIGTPVIDDGLVYIAVGQDPDHGEGQGHLWCIDPTKRGDVSPTLAMKEVDGKLVQLDVRRVQAVDPENGEVEKENPNSAVVWHYMDFDQNGDGELDFEETMHRTLGSCAIKDGVLYIVDVSGLLHCLDAKGENGQAKLHFTYDLLATSWGSPLITDGRVFVGDEDGDIAIFQLGDFSGDAEEINMGGSVYSTPIAANGRIYISTKDKLFAIEKIDE